jgi:hypothetical protein
MTPQPLEGFQHFTTHHCVTGSMRHVYIHNGHDISEEMLLGLGAGVSFSYWHFKGQSPFMGGRGGFKPPLEEATGQRTGVQIDVHHTTSARKARTTLLEILDAGQPVMVQCDMGFLPYYDFDGQEYHFGGHVVVVCGYDSQTDEVLVADRDEELHVVSMELLEQARGSTFKPFPPKHAWYTFDFCEKRPPTADEVRQAIREQTKTMLEPPIRNIGIAGIRKAADLVPKWSDVISAGDLRWTLFNAYIFISAVGGTGGGCFRYMLSRFLLEAAQITGERQLEESATEFERIGDQWEALAEWFRQVSEVDEPATRLGECAQPLRALAELEQVAWSRLREAVY